MKTSILFIFSFIIFSNVFSQELITMQGKYYCYGPEGRITNSEIGELISSSNDPEAIKYYSNYKTGKFIGISCFAVGAVLNVAGYDSSNPYDISGAQVAGTVLYGVGAIVLISKRQSLRKAVKRYNSLQNKAKLEFGNTRNGIGWSLKF